MNIFCKWFELIALLLAGLCLVFSMAEEDTLKSIHLMVAGLVSFVTFIALMIERKL